MGILDARRYADVRHSRWYAFAAALAVLGWLVAVIWQASGWSELRRTDHLTPTGQTLAARGSTVAVLTDLAQSGRDIRCFAKGPGAVRTTIAAAPLSLAVAADGTTWHLIALLTRGRDSTTVSCAPTDRRTDTANYATAVIADPQRRQGAPFAWGSLAAAALLAGATAFTRRLSAWAGAPKTSAT